MNARHEIDTNRLAEAVASLPGFATVRDAAARSGAEAHLVGGAVRDALLDRPTANLDLVVEGDPQPLLDALGGTATIYDRFETATIDVGGMPVDVARARTETYPQPGALPEVRPATVAEDLVRRDFTVNAMAVPVAAPGALADPHGGLRDLREGVLRVLHEESFVDDPTRALRAARYAARLDLEPEPLTLELLRATDLSAVSGDRVAAELGKLAAEPRARRGFELLGEWGLIELAPGTGELVERVQALLGSPKWAHEAPRAAAVLAAARGPGPSAHELAALRPQSPSAAVAAARGHGGVDLVLARALGGEWLDRYVAEWRDVGLEISGDDLKAAGVAEGPAVGRGLAAALRAKLDGEAPTRDDELRIALEAAAS